MWDHPCSLDDKIRGVSTTGGPALQALQPKYTKDWSLHPLPITCRDQEHGDACRGFPLSLACPHQIQTFSHGVSLAVPHAVIWERTGREETAELVSKQLNPQDLLWLLPHPRHGRRSQSGAGAARTDGLSAVPGAPGPSPVLEVPPLCQALPCSLCWEQGAVVQ